MMELLEVYSTERSWYGYWPQFEIVLMVYSAGIWIPLQFTRHYNSANLVRSTRGCTGSTDPIACLRTVPFDALMTAVNKSPERTFCLNHKNTHIFTFMGLGISASPRVINQGSMSHEIKFKRIHKELVHSVLSHSVLSTEKLAV